MQRRQEVLLEGCAVSKGIAIGIPFVLDSFDSVVPELNIEAKEVHKEISRYRLALQDSRADLLRLREELLREGIPDGVMVLEAHLQMIDDPLLNSKIEDEIKQCKKNAEFIFQRAIRRFKEKFESLQDPFFKQRFEDISDISKRILAYLREMKRLSLEDVPQNSIIFTHSLSPSEAAEAKRQRIGGFVTMRGGGTSHTAIVAKAKGIPYVASVNYTKIPSLQKSSMCIVDGLSGKIILNPSESTLIHYRKLKQAALKQQECLVAESSLPAETTDGTKVELLANLEVGDDFTEAFAFGAEGVGLFRSEYIVLQRGAFPSEEEQFEIYKNLAETMHGVPVVIRAFDIGLDKVACSLKGHGELNPALGLRAIRFLLQEKELLKAQLRAIIRASEYGDIRVLFPMVSGLSELLETKEVIQEVYQELETFGFFVSKKIKIGCMIEVPSIAMIIDLIAEECDFISIGTNDLTQYMLAVDRMNQKASAIYTSAHPGVIRVLKQIVDVAKRSKIPVSVCGEMASDPCMVPLLIGLGMTTLSVSCRYLPIIRHVIRSISKKQAEQIAKHVLSLKTAGEIYAFLAKEAAKNIAPGSIDHL